MTLAYNLREEGFVALQEDLRALADLVTRMARTARGFLSRPDPLLLKQLDAMEDEADRRVREVRRLCASLVASTSPLAKDLRLVAGALHAATDLERIGDEAGDLAQSLASSPRELPEADLGKLEAMADQAVSMVELSLRAFLGSDVALAERVGAMDNAVDALYLQLLYPAATEVDSGCMTPESRRLVVDTVIAAHALERIGDHATNLAEWAIYLQTGEFHSLNGLPDTSGEDASHTKR